MSTIGLGDVMPNNIQYSPLMSNLFLFGLALVSMVTNNAYDRMRLNTFGFIDVWDQKLEALYEKRHKIDHAPLNTITITVPAFPSDYGYVYDSKGRRSLSVQVNLDAIFPLMRAQFSTPEIKRYRRSYSSGRALPRRTLTPTLGILSTNDGMRKSIENEHNFDGDI